MKHNLPVALIVLVLVVLGMPPGVSEAAEVPSTGSLDTLRCEINWNGTLARSRCHYDPVGSTWIAGATESGVPHSTSPLYVVGVPGLNACNSSLTYFAIGPKTPGEMSAPFSGAAIPAGGVEVVQTYVTPGTCVVPTTGSLSARLRYTANTADHRVCEVDVGCTITTVPGADDSWPSWPADHYPGGSSAYELPPTMSCERSVSQLGSGSVRLRVTVGFDPALDPPPSTYTPTDVGGLTPTITVSGLNIEMDVPAAAVPDDGRFYTGLATDLGVTYNPSTVQCVLWVDLADPESTLPDGSVPTESSSYDCPNGWGLLNPTNLLRLGKCLFIPRSDLVDELLGYSNVPETGVDVLEPDLGLSASSISQLDDTSIYYPVALVGQIALDVADQASVSDAEVGECYLGISWSSGLNAANGYTGVDSPIPDSPTTAGSDVFAAFGSNALISTNLCPYGSPQRTGVMYVRWLSLFVASTSGLWMAVRFVRKLGTYRSSTAAPA